MPMEPRAPLEDPRASERSVRACLLIPIYNHKDTIGGVLDSLADLGLPCLVVDDGSNESTQATLRRDLARKEARPVPTRRVAAAPGVQAGGEAGRVAGT